MRQMPAMITDKMNTVASQLQYVINKCPPDAKSLDVAEAIVKALTDRKFKALRTNLIELLSLVATLENIEDKESSAEEPAGKEAYLYNKRQPKIRKFILRFRTSTTKDEQVGYIDALDRPSARVAAYQLVGRDGEILSLLERK